MGDSHEKEIEEIINIADGISAMIILSIEAALAHHHIIDHAAVEFAKFITKNKPPLNSDILAEMDQIAMACLSKACSDELAKMVSSAKRKEN